MVSMVRRLPVFVFLASAAALPAPALAVDAKEFKKKFLATQNSWERRALVSQLDPSDEDSLDLLLKFVLKTQDWYMREAAVQVLSTVYDEGVIGKLTKLKDKDPVICEGVCMAFGLSKNLDRLDYLIEMIGSKKWNVRRAAAIALRTMKDKRAIDALISAWEEEDKFLVWVQILESLETLTRQKNMPTAQDWRDWWTVARDNFEFSDGSDELSEDEKSGEVIKTRARGTNLSMRRRGKGLPLLVLPDYGYEKDYLETYLRNLEDTNQIFYMDLPGVVDFVDPPLQNAPNLPNPYYPLDRIVDAFEELQQDLVKKGVIKEKFALLAHGISCWIAMTYADRHPRSVRRMILIAASSGQKAAGEGINALERRGQELGDLELEHYAQSRIYDQQKGGYKYQPQPGEESAAIDRKAFTVRFADQRDLEIGRIYGPVVEKKVGKQGIARVPRIRRPMGGCFIPEFSLFNLKRVPIPTLVLHGKYSVETSEADARAIAKHYGRNARVITFKRSGQMPFIEENEKFVEGIRRFLGGKKAKKKKKKRKKKR
ncbi:MAG: alpha/beta fold hydrolase [Planctomycetota bacterium]|nr:MAG: alpha/beta fold hydrolase [Planctomycetota bacterium]